MRSAAGTVPQRAQAGMKDSWKERGYFYSCVCVPQMNLEIVSADAEIRMGASVASLDLLSGDVMRACLTADQAIEFRAGQYVTLVRNGLARSYSIASLPEAGKLELHIRKIPNGQMSGWFHDAARIGDTVSVVGPSGECFYVTGREDQPMILAGTGTGLAPLYGILRDALQRGHRGRIHLFHGALNHNGLYLVEELRDLALRHPQFEYTPAVLRSDASHDVAVGPIDSVILSRIPNFAGWRGFVCGDPGLVQMLKKKLFLAGMASRDIYADAFLPAAPS
jgi:CDP-4-dehydro-6-deoxyglucose reductase, E3